jgi:hypothetical protein
MLVEFCVAAFEQLGCVGYRCFYDGECSGKWKFLVFFGVV